MSTSTLLSEQENTPAADAPFRRIWTVRETSDSLMVRKWVSTNSTVKYARVIGVLSGRAKIEDPEVLAVSVFEELFRVFPAIPIETLHAHGRISHDNHLVSDVHQVYRT